MKHISKIVCFLLILSLVLPQLPVSAQSYASTEQELRGVWVATVLNIDYPSKATADPEILKTEALKMLDHAEYMGLNAVFLQVRPASDAIYKSKYYPWSKYLTGKQGLMPEDGFDPLEFWINEAHKRGIQLQAWINPYRVTKKTYSEPKHDFNSLDPKNPARVKPEWVVKHTDGNLYYNPGIPEVRKLVIDGVLEIIENYDIDGIHFDDYFYPDKDFNDKAAYAKYGSTYKSIDDWRRANVNTLIADLSKAIKAADSNVKFGISPFGIWANKGKNPLGSDTNGMQSYYDQYADTRKWVKEKYLDYIAPQIYWNIGYKAADYSKLLPWWQDVTAGTGVDLYIGQAAYRSIEAGPSSPWYGTAEIERQLQLNSKSPEVKGSIFFSNKSLTDNPALCEAIKKVYGKKDSRTAGQPVSVARPAEDMRTGLEKFYIHGSSDPYKPLYLNGKPVENRSSQGYFGVLVPLSEGANNFTFTQEGSSVTRTIYRDIASPTPKKISRTEILPDSVFPQAEEYRSPGEKITLSCKAPAGSKLTVKIGGKTYDMKGAAISNGAGLYEDTYTYIYTVPSYTGTPRNIDLGAPVYTMNYKGIINSRQAPAKLGVIMKGSPFYAKVEKDVIYSYKTTSTSDGAAYELYSGMTDQITGMTGKFVRLSLGQWVNKSDVLIYTAQSQLRPGVRNANYSTGDWWDTMNLSISSAFAATADFDGKTMSLTISSSSSAAAPVLPEDSPFAAVEVSRNGNQVKYSLPLKSDYRIEGYYIQMTPTGLALNIKRPVKAKDGERPLAGIMIMLDPGHGGSDPGAIGPLGLKYPEKTINLSNSLKLKAELEKLGARVVMTRTDDVNMSLEERLSASRDYKPDLFISLHANSMADNVDISKIDGFSAFYREKLSQPLAGTIFDKVLGSLSRNNKGIHNKNFYVIRSTWTPAVLLEAGFVPNPYEFEWLIDDKEQSRLVRVIAEAIVEYLK